VGTTANNRYSIGSRFFVQRTLPHVLGLFRDIIPLAHAAAKTGGTGYEHIYHIFVPKGIDVCADDPRNMLCYSPDRPSSFLLCAFHFRVNFSDIGHVLVTVEPFQDVPECAAQVPSPNGQLADSTNSPLSHELFETITDPDVGASWIAAKSLDLHGFEIGDICQPILNAANDFLVPTFLINGKKYEVQLEYSNKYHGCTNAP